MKTKLHLFITAIICTISTNYLNAQSWVFNGNNTTGQTIGTNNAEPFIIETDDLERVQVNVNGNVGIGTVYPFITSKLQVNNDDPINTFVSITNGTTGLFDGLRIGVDPSGNSRIETSTGPLLLFKGTTETIRIHSANRIGIGQSGTFTPQSQLHLHADVNQNYLQVATIYAGTGANDGFKVGVNEDAIAGNMPNAEVRQQEDAHLLFFTGNTEYMRITRASENGCVGVSTQSPQAKLHVNNPTEAVGTLSQSTYTSNGFNIGVAGTASNATLANIGVVGQAKYPIGFFSVTHFLGIVGPPYSAGVIGHGSGSRLNFGGIFEANDCNPGVINYGVYASAKATYALTPFSQVCTTGIAGYFDGIISVTGIVANTSDEKFKDSVNAISNALSVLNRLHPKSFVFKGDNFPSINFVPGKNYGVIAQELDTVLPELIHSVMHPALYDTSGNLIYDTIPYKTVNYTGLIPITIAAIQEQQQLIDSLAATQVSAQTNPTDTNRIVKWSGVNNVLANSLLYDNGTAIGMPTVKPGSYFNVANTSDTVALSVSSTHSGTTAVVDVAYNGGTAADHAVAVRGTSIHAISGGGTGGWGARFEGGQLGVAGLGSGNGSTVAGVQGSASGASFANIGVLGNTEAIADTMNIGVFGTSANAEMGNAGVVAAATESSASAINYGSYNVAARSQHENMAGYFNAEDTIGLNYGVYSEVYAMDSDAWAGYFKGNVHYTGRLTAGSDAKLKANIQPLKTDSALALLAKLQPKTYTYNSSAVQNLGMPTGKQYGLIAQEVQQVLPELVSHITQPETRNLKGQIIHQQEHYLGLNYHGIIPVLIGAVKEHQQEIKTQQSAIDSLKNVINNKLAALENRINNCCGIGGINHKTDETTPNENAVSVELSNTQVIVLEQNAPNPFAEQTTINYHIPTGMGDGQMVFTDMLGNIIKTAEVKNGYGTVTVFAQNLSSGQYSYTLIVNGKTIETKKMMKQR